MPEAAIATRTGLQVAIWISAALFVLLVPPVSIFLWITVEGIRNPEVDQLPERADAVMVFAGEDGRFTIGRKLVEGGIAPVLVLNAAGLSPNALEWCVENTTSFDIVCLTPTKGGTRGEAQAFGALADARGWSAVIGVTGDYHVQRASMMLNRCFDGEVFMAQLEWDSVPMKVLRKELLALTYGLGVSRTC